MLTDHLVVSLERKCYAYRIAFGGLSLSLSFAHKSDSPFSQLIFTFKCRELLRNAEPASIRLGYAKVLVQIGNPYAPLIGNDAHKSLPDVSDFIVSVQELDMP